MAAEGAGGHRVHTGVMVASHEIPLIVSAYQKGIRNYDIQKAYEAIRHNPDGARPPP